MRTKSKRARKPNAAPIKLSSGLQSRLKEIASDADERIAALISRDGLEQFALEAYFRGARTPEEASRMLDRKIAGVRAAATRRQRQLLHRSPEVLASVLDEVLSARCPGCGGTTADHQSHSAGTLSYFRCPAEPCRRCDQIECSCAECSVTHSGIRYRLLADGRNLPLLVRLPEPYDETVEHPYTLGDAEVRAAIGELPRYVQDVLLAGLDEAGALVVEAQVASG